MRQIIFSCRFYSFTVFLTCVDSDVGELLIVKQFPHVLHEYGFSPVWVFIWVKKLLFLPKCSHKFHNDMVSHLCWFFMMDFFLKTFPQMSHVTKFLSASVLHWLWFYLTSKHFFNFSWETPATFSLTVFSPHCTSWRLDDWTTEQSTTK